MYTSHFGLLTGLRSFRRKNLPLERKYSKFAKENALTAQEKNVSLVYKRDAGPLWRVPHPAKLNGGIFPRQKNNLTGGLYYGTVHSQIF